MVPDTGINTPTPRDETHPQNMTAILFLSSEQIKYGAWFSSLLLHIRILRSFPITTIVSSEKATFFQSSIVQSLFSLQKFNRFFRLAGLIKIFFFNTLLLKPVRLKWLLIVVWENFWVLLWLNSEQSFLNVIFLFDFTRRNRRFVSRIVHRGFLPLNPMFSREPVFFPG